MKLKSFIIPSLIVVLTTISCKRDEFFDRERVPQFPWQNVSEFEMAATTGYRTLFIDGSWSGGPELMDRVIWDAMSDIGYYTQHVEGHPMREAYMREFSNSETVDRMMTSYGQCYEAINNINVALDWSVNENNENPFPGASESDKTDNVKRIIGELYLMRGIAYSRLAFNFAAAPGNPLFSTEKSLPKRLTIPATTEGYMTSEWMTAKETYDILISDMKKAIERLPWQFSSTMHASYQFGRAQKAAAHMALARVYFQLYPLDIAYGDSALINLDAVINSGLYDLTQSPIEAFNKSDATQGKEVIWYALFYDKLGSIPKEVALMSKNHIYQAKNGGRGKDWNIGLWRNLSFGMSAATKVGWATAFTNGGINLISDEAKTDIRYLQLYYTLYPKARKEATNDTLTETVRVSAMDTLTLVWGDKYFRGADGEHTNVPVMRLAETYLTRAILRLNKGDMVGATYDLNMIRRRAGLKPVSIATAELIEIERIKELSFEGDRIHYLMALKMDIPAGDRVGVAAVKFPYDGFHWNLPKTETDLNPKP